MARIAGVDLPRDKRVEIGLTYIYGIGLRTSQRILSETNVNPDIRVKDLDENDLSKIREYIDKNIKVEGDLRREVSLNIKRLMEIGCYRGIRHRKGLPVRGQSTKQNACLLYTSSGRASPRLITWQRYFPELLCLAQFSLRLLRRFRHCLHLRRALPVSSVQPVC